LAVRALDFSCWAKNYLLKILLAILAAKFKYWHKHAPHLFYQKEFKKQEFSPSSSPAAGWLFKVLPQSFFRLAVDLRKWSDE
jgi:hypothetical protein